jgi:Trypsin
VSRFLRPYCLLAIAAALLAPGLATPAAAQDTPQPRIVGGTNASPDEYPYQVYLEIDTVNGTFACGGSVLDATHIATAAHCVVDEDAGPYPQVVAAQGVRAWHGGTDRPGGVNDPGYPEMLQAPSVITVSADKRYRRGGRDFVYDSAVLTLAQPLDLDGPSTKAIPLANAADVSNAFTTPLDATITGWGGRFEGDPVGTEVLQEADVPLVTDAVCRDTFGDDIEDTVMICAGDESPPLSRDTCQGDSGGPLAIPGVGSAPSLAGITSFGGVCGAGPGVYTEVDEPATTALLSDDTQTPPPTASAEPTVTGTFRVGEQVTCNTTPVNGSVTEYLWYEFDGADYTRIAPSTRTITLPTSAMGDEVLCDARIEGEESGFFYSVATQSKGPVGPASSGSTGSGSASGPGSTPQGTPLPPGLADIGFGGFPRRASLRRITRRNRHLAGRISCDADCRFRAELILPRRSARKARVRGRPAVVSRVRSSDAAGGRGRTIRFRFRRSTAAKLRRLTRGTVIEVRVTAVDPRGTRRVEKKKLRLKR